MIAATYPLVTKPGSKATRDRVGSGPGAANESLRGDFGKRVRKNVLGAVHPKSGKLVSLIVPHCDGDVFQGFLDTMAEEAPPTQGRRCVLVLDNASWHKVKTLNWHHLEPVDLPPDSPDFNPIEPSAASQKSLLGGIHYQKRRRTHHQAHHLDPNPSG
ncbi:MAG: transposase [Verrucomicrobiales bacterium]